jgi:photosystem II stability/assembly factor-like uncharacterized protein
MLSFDMPSMPRTLLLLTLLAIAVTTKAQWQLQDAHTTADLRGIDNVGHGVAWASGTDGTILRTEDAGFVWQLCAKPPNAEHLDFRAIQAFDNNTAIIMSSGKGDLSRLYKTTDGCQTWKLLFTNPDRDGFWDALRLADSGEGSQFLSSGLLLGDPVDGKFPIWSFSKFGQPELAKRIRARPEEAAFAASNTSLFDGYDAFWIATGGKQGSRVIRSSSHGADELSFTTYPSSAVPVGGHTESSGVFSIEFAHPPGHFIDNTRLVGVAVGGDYKQPNETSNISAYTTDSGKHWTASTTPPHGYRSAVAYDARTKAWITVGPNGTDISTDDGRNWRALRPSASDTPDADQHWNALSLPFVVGPHGRIGKLNPKALAP